ncbi:fasciclin domain-containing protein [Albibacterium profundi]|uniref:Fasciclin domain-containing protein n=1 Tax=Albibacterium profundi TaxID=3134906 RepID=A0ABV5CCQ4_9SPHI
MRSRNIFLILFVSSIIVTACNKQDYYLDSGTHNGKYDGTVYEYLNAKPAYFDTLMKVIDVAGMKEVLENEEITFFAPPSSSIYKSVRSLNQYLRNDGKDTVSELSQIKSEVWQEMLSLYIFKGKYMLKDYAQVDTLDLEAFGGQGFTSYGGRSMNIGVIYNDAGGVKYAGYRQLWLSYISDFSKPKGSLINIPIASSNIEPTNGAIHVLQYRNHVFGFTSSNFILSATSKGIDPVVNEE